VLARRGKQYDARRIIDLARYLSPYPAAPVWFRRRMLAIGSGDPTKAICSTLIAAAFDPLSDLAADRLDRRQDLWVAPQARPDYAARFRCVAVFRHRQTHDWRRIRLSRAAMGCAGGKAARIFRPWANPQSFSMATCHRAWPGRKNVRASSEHEGTALPGARCCSTGI
jgi:hypothetical protein